MVSPANLLSGWDTALLMAPLAVMLAAWMFRLDELLASPRKRGRGHNFSGRAALTDPDGKPWRVAEGSERPGSKSRTVENFGPGQAVRVPLLPISQYKSF